MIVLKALETGTSEPDFPEPFGPLITVTNPLVSKRAVRTVSVNNSCIMCLLFLYHSVYSSRHRALVAGGVRSSEEMEMKCGDSQ